ncbi:MAG: DUF547 domain-containing protein [Planctomycetota bacterium]
MTPHGARRISTLVIILALASLVHLMPLDRLMTWMTRTVDMWGWRGGFLFGGFYVACALLFIPGSALTLAGGALFGLGWGTLVVSLASTTSAGLAFLIGRHVARNAVHRWAGKSPKFSAIDRAIGTGGWKIISLLRLSPAIPFSLGNYLFGLTSIAFWPYLLASWISMLPGTFMYVYLGYASREGLASAGSTGQGKTPGEWALLILGLVATLIVTVYVTQLARKAIQESTTMTLPPITPTPPTEQPRWNTQTCFLILVALVLSCVSACAHSDPSFLNLSRWFGPPQVVPQESYGSSKGGSVFNHERLDALLKLHVNTQGMVDYRALLRESANLDLYLQEVASAPVNDMSRDQRLAYLINAYNACTLRLILDHYPLASIKDIPADKRWDAVRWKIGGRTLSLSQIEHEEIRPHFREPRIHFALVCAAKGCPPLRAEAYDANRLEAQLEAQARYVHTHPAWFVFSPSDLVLKLTSLYDWYRSDFEQAAGGLEPFASKYSASLERALAQGQTPKLEFLDYDWSLNEQEKP